MGVERGPLSVLIPLVLDESGIWGYNSLQDAVVGLGDPDNLEARLWAI